MPRRFVSYLRVSTDRQGKSGFGLEAQRAAVAAHLAGGTWTLLDEMVEVESRRAMANRLQLARAGEQFTTLLHARSGVDRSEHPGTCGALRMGIMAMTENDMPNPDRVELVRIEKSVR